MAREQQSVGSRLGKVVDLVDGVLQLERDEVLLAATRSLHLISVYFFGHNQPGIRVF